MNLFKKLCKNIKDTFWGNVTISNISHDSVVQINGNIVKGNNIRILDGNITIDGQEYAKGEKSINITIEGNVGTIEAEVCDTIRVNGDVDSITTTTGDVEVTGNVKGDIDTSSGDIECGEVKGNINTMSGDVDCGDIIGDVETMSGDIECKKR